ncbi:predicted protein [Nematostella vectensis]|uniref:Sedoheptulokinase n=1 Tax=Nematostella vectensis TaxID=45351 RepID=A7SWA4_NEMVE|nr:sedoheptulokinase [Nematostella vectensis]EDO32028.1 predicted protein [Nematostella vectensis]|eukprot:XP_001624128.1 predicted protein [Nematostella vectensis]
MAAKTKYVLGIDLGTSSIKATLLEIKSKWSHARYSEQTSASIQSENHNFAIQDPDKILKTLERVLFKFERKDLENVTKISICGQMHGCMFWKKDYLFTLLQTRGKDDGIHLDKESVSSLITWEDRRCTDGFLSSLPNPSTNIPISTGYGCASIFWLTRNKPGFLDKFDCSGTVMDFVVSMFCCSLRCGIMSSHNAVSWGYYDNLNKRWELESLQAAEFPVHLLPNVYEPGTIVGLLFTDYCGIPKGTPVGAALGDFHCSMYACQQNKTDAVLNIGTSSQFAILAPVNHQLSVDENESCEAWQMWPYFKGDQVMVAASLHGGNVITHFAETVKSWMEELKIQEIPNTETIYKNLLASADSMTTLAIRPTIWGERHSTNLTGMVSNILSGNTSLGDITAAICQGMLANLHEMLPGERSRRCGVKRIVGTGRALVQNDLMQELVKQVWGLPLVLCKENDASLGAALAVLECN